MRKYILTMCLLFLHTTTNSPRIKDAIGQIDQSINQSDDDSKIFVRKGGIHSATWYNPHGARTASGDRFHKDSLTAAYNYSKIGSYLRVTNISDSSSIIVRVNDRMGDMSKNHIDLSKCAFDSIGNPKSGRLKVYVEELKFEN